MQWDETEEQQTCPQCWAYCYACSSAGFVVFTGGNPEKTCAENADSNGIMELMPMRSASQGSPIEPRAEASEPGGMPADEIGGRGVGAEQ